MNYLNELGEPKRQYGIIATSGHAPQSAYFRRLYIAYKTNMSDCYILNNEIASLIQFRQPGHSDGKPVYTYEGWSAKAASRYSVDVL